VILIPKLEVVGSSPIARSRFPYTIPAPRQIAH